MVTRPREQAASLVNALREAGAKVIEAPAIRIEPPPSWEPLDEALAHLARYDWVIFTSTNGVGSFFQRWRQARKSGSLSDVRFAAIGPVTARVLSEHDVRVHLLPERFVAEEVYDALVSKLGGEMTGKRFLLPRADIAREALPDALRSAGAVVDVVVAYRTVTALPEIEEAVASVERGEVDVVTFTSGSTVRSFFEAVRMEPGRSALPAHRFLAASIGPITSAALRQEGVEPAIEATTYTAEGLVEAIHRFFASR